MSKIVDYFCPQENLSYFDQLKTGFFIRMCFIGIVIISLGGLSACMQQHKNFSVSLLSNVVNFILLWISLFILKYKNIKIAGNFFSLVSVISLLVFINILSPMMDVTYKYVLGLYSIFGFLVFHILYASRPVIIINTLLSLATTLHVYLFSIRHQPEQKELFTSAYFNHTLVLLGMFIAIYYTNKFVELAILRANNDLKEKEKTNQELLSTEEEIRASNEELVATTDALVEANEDLTEAMKKAEESDKLKTEFLNNMSHEVRTPMNGIIGFSQLLDIPDLTESSRSNYINTIQSSSHQLLSIIDNIIEISKLGTKQIKVFEQQLNLNKMLHELYLVFENEITEKAVSLKLVTALPEGDDTILIDEIKLYKILSNLLENALKFTERGLVEFGYQITTKHTLDKEGYAIQFYVKDSGIGILPEQQEVIFNRFSQADANLSRQFGGLGLGLSIAKENTELLMGKVSVESEWRKGSTFFVTIPFKPVSKV